MRHISVKYQLFFCDIAAYLTLRVLFCQYAGYILKPEMAERQISSVSCRFRSYVLADETVSLNLPFKGPIHCKLQHCGRVTQFAFLTR